MSEVNLLSIQVGLPRQLGVAGAADPTERPWTTGFFKEPIVGPVHVGKTNLIGDGQADLTVHGGPDKAVLAYAAEHYPVWQAELGIKTLGYGAFGENFTIAGQSEETVAIGDTYALGPVRLQVSQPRQPCWKLARRWRRPDLPGRVQKTGWGGWYFRVLAEGVVEAGLPVVLLERPYPRWTVLAANDIMYRRNRDQQAIADLANCPALSVEWRTYLTGRFGDDPDA